MVRICWLLSASVVYAQSTISTYTFDINGRPVSGVGTVQSGGSRSIVTRDSNGRTVPVESVEERVISEGNGMRIVERVVKRYDPNGNPGPPEKIRIEEQKETDGAVRTVTTVSRGDINGGFQLTERSTSMTRSSSGRMETTTTIERPTLNGSFDFVEQLNQTITAAGPKTIETVTIQRRNANGRMGDVSKKVREAASSNGRVNETTVEYESVSTGQMRLMRQSTAQIDANGTRAVRLFLPDGQGALKVSQEQIIQQSDTPTGTVETTTVRLALPNDPGKLGPARKVEETICTGACGRTAQP